MPGDKHKEMTELLTVLSMVTNLDMELYKETQTLTIITDRPLVSLN
jgi:hypothetical protein